uniref:Chromosome 4 open reading frame 48 n=1 Tax=Nothobranchius pienaari TaxID=704102 RepID=A0A1A8LUN3_9TELE
MNSPPKITEMVFSCSAMGCTNRQGEYPNLSFHRFPKNDRERRSKWTAAIRRKYWEPGPYARVCGEHFILGKRSDDPNHPDYVPSIFSFSSPSARAQALKTKEKHLKRLEMNEKKPSDTEEKVVPLAEADATEATDHNPPCALYFTKVTHQNPASDVPEPTALPKQHHSSEFRADAKEAVPQIPAFTLFITNVLQQNPGIAALPKQQPSSNVTAEVADCGHRNPPSNVPDTLALLDWHRSVPGLGHQNPTLKVYASTGLQDQHHSPESRVDVSELIHQCPQIKSEPSEHEHQISKLTVLKMEVQADETLSGIVDVHKLVQSLNTECQFLKDKVCELETKLKHQTFQISLTSDAKVEYFTGLPNKQTYELLLTYVSSVFPSSCSLEPSQELLMMLIKLRLNLTDELLGHLFGIEQSTVSTIFQRWVKVVADRLQSLVLWPDREEFRRSLPKCYQSKFKNCVSIAHCLGVLVEPGAETHTSDKEHNTVKFLISITPEGTISFVSKPSKDCISNRDLFENVEFLQNLQPRDLVLPAWGFEANDRGGLFCAEVATSLTGGSVKWFNFRYIASSEENVQVKAHVKRLIGMLRQKYPILGSTVPLGLARQIVVICSALCNLCETFASG